MLKLLNFILAFNSCDAEPPDQNPAALLERNLDQIDRAVAYVARRHQLSPDERDELASRVNLKLVDNDYAVLRRFQGRSSLKTWLVTVVQSTFLDYRNQLWGKWRPSRMAERLGPTAVRLEMFCQRENNTLDEAIARLTQDPAVTEDETTLRQMATQLPDRTGRRFVEEAEASHLPAPQTQGESHLIEKEKSSAIEHVEKSLAEILAGIDVEDRMIVKMHYHDDMKVSHIARALGLDQKKLYKRLERMMARFRKQLEQLGHERSQVLELLR